MKLTTADFAKLQYSLLAALLMLAIGAAAAYFAFAATTTATRQRQAVQAERDDAERKLQRVRLEESDIREKSLVFNQLQARGVIGEERRLEWVELLKAIAQQRQLLEVQYEIAPQRPLDALQGGNYAFFASAMHVQLKLLHGEDLTRLLGDLRAQANALILVRRCGVSRLPGGVSEADAISGVQPTLQADCVIDWVTLREVAANPLH
ncbi:MAG: hypothetical protein ABI478_04025, partial [Propionivibrio sp.]